MTPDVPPGSPRPIIRSRPDPAAYRALTGEVLTEVWHEDERRMRRGANWFYWVAALSLVNSVIALFKGGVVFLAGLAVSQILDAIALHLSGFGPYFNLGLDLVIAFFICGIGYLAAQGSKVALLIGMILYALDGVIFLLFGAILPALFHAFVLYQIYKGWVARRELDALRAGSPVPPAGSTL